MNLNDIFARVITSTPLDDETIDLAQFEGLTASQIWRKVDEFLNKFGLELFCISSLDSTQSEAFAKFINGDNFEYNILGLRELSTNETILFDDMIYAIGNTHKVSANKQMLVDFYKRVKIFDCFLQEV